MIKKFLLVLFITLLAVYLTAACLNARSENEKLAELQPMGKLIEVGDSRMHLLCLGEAQSAAPTVLLEAGTGDNHLSWYGIQQDLSNWVRVCAYDRAGYGWSDPSHARRDVETISGELDSMLESAGIAPPYLLVGHSFGGLVLRYFAAQHPGDTIGLLLVDSTPAATLLNRQSGMRKPLLLVPPTLTMLGAILEKAGIYHWLTNVGRVDQFEAVAALPPLLQSQAEALYYRFPTLATSALEQFYLARSAQLVIETPLPADLPVLALVSTAEGAPEMLPLIQSEFATLTSRSQVLTVQNGHYNHLENPGLVVDLARQLLDSSP